ncbi:hypothetical protein LLG95_17105 [bacterium]|nr:hypothetical protein [bacterium]
MPVVLDYEHEHEHEEIIIMTLPKRCSSAEAAGLVASLGEEFAVVRNPGYIHPPYELYPLAPRTVTPLPELAAVVSDMDGTTTTTEHLCVYSLDYMVRRMTGRPAARDWAGLGDRDHPHVIGNSTTKHVEYLVDTYGGAMNRQAFLEALLESILWTIALSRDDARREEARNTATNLGLDGLIKSGPAGELIAKPSFSMDSLRHTAHQLALGNLDRFNPTDRNDLVRGGIEIYYARYHQILEGIGQGRAETLARQLLGEGRRLIEPMPGVGLFLAAIKGLVTPQEAGVLFDAQAVELLKAKGRPVPSADGLTKMRADFVAAVECFGAKPLPVAIVTSSLGYEARIVLGELFSVIRGAISEWPVPRATRDKLLEHFASPDDLYDAILTATDSSEIRLKPHRDLYSMALHRLGIGTEKFGRVLGLEDSESGVIGIRASGIGLAVAVPFDQTLGHDLSAATKICPGGLPQVMFEERFFMTIG